MDCPNCHSGNRDGALFCNACGHQLQDACPPTVIGGIETKKCWSCGHENPLTISLCVRCGHVLGTRKSRASRPATRPAERLNGQKPASDVAVPKKSTVVTVRSYNPNARRRPKRPLLAAVAAAVVGLTVTLSAFGYFTYNILYPGKPVSYDTVPQGAEALAAPTRPLVSAAEAPTRATVAQGKPDQGSKDIRRPGDGDEQAAVRPGADSSGQKAGSDTRQRVARASIPSVSAGAGPMKSDISDELPNPPVHAAVVTAGASDAGACSGLSGMKLEQCRACGGLVGARRFFCDENIRERHCDGKSNPAPECPYSSLAHSHTP